MEPDEPLRAQYMRFQKAVMAPGRAADNVEKVRLRPPPPKPGEPPKPVIAASAAELVDEIAIGHTWVRLTATKNEVNARRVHERFVHVSNVLDWEPMPPTEEPRKERNR
jgi:hypothetical protein